MRLLGVGPKLSHTLIGIEPDRARRTSVRHFTLIGGTELICQMVKGISSRNIDSTIISLNSEPIVTLAECWNFQPDANKSEEELWRIDKILGQTQPELVTSLKLNAKDCGDQVLVAEVPSDENYSPATRSLAKEWEVSGTNTENAWAVVKTESPEYLGSKLYDSIHALHGDRQIVVMSLSTARLMKNSPLIKSLSWESTAEAIQAALIREFKLRKLADKLPNAIIVTIMNDGAAYFRCNSGQPVLTLTYDPNSIEGEWTKARKGQMPGTTQCITAAVAAGVIQEPAGSMSKYVIAGLHGARELHDKGFQLRVGAPSPFPVSDVVNCIKESISNFKKELVFKTIDIPKGDSENPGGNEVNWSIAREAFLPGRAGEDPITWMDKRETLFEFVRTGDYPDGRVPMAKFDELTAVLRDDIEGLRAIRGLMREYSARLSNKRPLSIAVFGSPGSGKSFGVKAVANSISDSRRKFQTLEFNLSQFSAPDQLYQALHQVRDSALAGNVPLVFFDEFDANFQGDYGWLRYFLAPMQDGKFTQGQISHSVGDAVFVFAGGTSSDFQTFRKLAEKATTAKGPDFLSRLQGFLNIADLNHSQEDCVLLGGVLIRRAMLLRALLKKLAPKIENSATGLDIDDTVITAFLRIREFRFSARSMESILNMSSLHDRTHLDSSCLPPIAQIDLHVDGLEWLALLEDSDKSDNKAGTNPYVISW